MKFFWKYKYFIAIIVLNLQFFSSGEEIRSDRYKLPVRVIDYLLNSEYRPKVYNIRLKYMRYWCCVKVHVTLQHYSFVISRKLKYFSIHLMPDLCDASQVEWKTDTFRCKNCFSMFLFPCWNWKNQTCYRYENVYRRLYVSKENEFWFNIFAIVSLFDILEHSFAHLVRSQNDPSFSSTVSFSPLCNLIVTVNSFNNLSLIFI